jgi:hypothetical protein
VSSKNKRRGYCNYELFLEHLKARIPYDACPNFFSKPRGNDDRFYCIFIR